MTRWAYSRRSSPIPGGGPWGHLRRCGQRAVLIGATALIASTPGVAQETGRIAGRVTDAASGAPISEAQVYIPASGIGTITRSNGTFVILQVAAGTHEIRAERIGLTAVTQQVTVTAGEVTEVNFQLSTQALGLDEIVVTGTAGAARRREIGNSVSQINTADLPNRPESMMDLLKAAAPGVEVSSIGGELGQGSQIRLRGNGSVSMSNQPLIYIDGVRMQNELFPVVIAPGGPRSAHDTPSPLASVAPQDIERIEIIKGSAATTLYGTEASAGVIQIFTKKGSSGAPVWTVETQQGARWSRKFAPPERPYFGMQPWLQTGWIQDYSVSVRGGGEAFQYFTSGNHAREEGVLVTDQSETWGIRGNFGFSPADGLQLQWNTAFNHRWGKNQAGANNAHGVTLNAMRGDANYVGGYDIEKISALLDYDIQSWIDRFTTGGTVTYSPTGALTNRLTVGYDYSQRVVDNLRPFGFRLLPAGALYTVVFESRLLTFDYVATYAFNLTSALRSNFSWGGQAVGQDTHTYTGHAQDFPGAKAPTVSSGAVRIAGEEEEKVWTAGFFFQNVFDISDRYFLTLGVRVDGNSAFGENFGLQAYPKASASWVISDEDWWQPGWGTMKLRGAYGTSGRAPGVFDAVRTWEAAGWAGVPAFRPRNVGNADLGPEVTGELELGFDGSWFDDRLSAQFTYYNQKTTDALFEVTQTPSQGFRESQLKNVGEIRNTGIELALNTSPVVRADWRWDFGVNASTNNSEVLSLGGAPSFSIGRAAWIIEGQPVPVMRGELVTNPDQAGDPVFAAEDHNFGPNLPTLILGLNTSVQLPGGLQISASGDYRAGHQRLITPGWNSVRRTIRFPACFPYYVVPEPTLGTSNQSVELRPDTPAIWRARCTPNVVNNGSWVFPGDFFRLRSVSALIPVDFLFPERVSNASLMVSLNDSYTWVKDFPVYTPEQQSNNGSEQVVGVTDRVPSPISFRASLRITF